MSISPNLPDPVNPIAVAKSLEISFAITPTQIIPNPTICRESSTCTGTAYQQTTDPYNALYSNNGFTPAPTPVYTQKSSVILIPTTLTVSESDVPGTNPNINVGFERLNRLHIPPLFQRYRGVMPIAIQGLNHSGAIVATATPYYPPILAAGIGAGYNPFTTPPPTLTSMLAYGTAVSNQSGIPETQAAAQKLVAQTKGQPIGYTGLYTPGSVKPVQVPNSNTNTYTNNNIHGATYTSGGIPTNNIMSTAPVNQNNSLSIANTRASQIQNIMKARLAANAKTNGNRPPTYPPQNNQQMNQQQMNQQQMNQQQMNQQQMNQQQMNQQQMNQQQMNQQQMNQQQNPSTNQTINSLNQAYSQQQNLIGQVNNDINTLNTATNGNLSQNPYAAQSAQALRAASDLANSTAVPMSQQQSAAYYAESMRTMGVYYEPSATTIVTDPGYCGCGAGNGTFPMAYPTFTCVTRYDESEHRMILTYVLYINAYNAYKQTVYLNEGILLEVTNNVIGFIPGISTANRVNMLLCSNLFASEAVPSPEAVYGAYIIWLFTFIGFIGATKWTVTGKPWITVVDFAHNTYDTNFFFSNDPYNVDYFLSQDNLRFADLALTAMYPVILIQYQRLCSIANGCGWYVLMYDDPSEEQLIYDNIYRRFFIITAFLTVDSWRQRRLLLDHSVNLANINGRLNAYEQAFAMLGVYFQPVPVIHGGTAGTTTTTTTAGTTGITTGTTSTTTGGTTNSTTTTTPDSIVVTTNPTV